MQYAFDLDGTLVDTRTAVLKAYQEVGVDPPEDFFGRPWYEWLHDADKHDAKNKVYPSFLHGYAKKLPLFDLYLSCPAPAYILTGASRVAVEAVMERFNRQSHTTALLGGKSELRSTFTECTLEDKIVILSRLGMGVYFDDDPVAVSIISARTEWTTCLVQ